MNYLLHAALLLSICFLFYRLLLQRETFYRLHRWLLLGGLIAAFGLPLLTIPAAWSFRAGEPAGETRTIAEAIQQTAPVPVEPTVAPAPVAASPEEHRAQAVTQPSVPVAAAPAEVSVWARIQAQPWLRWAALLYLGGVVVFLLQFLMQLGLLLYRRYRHPGYLLEGFRIVEIDGDHAPYSFWDSIFLNPHRYDTDTYHQIVQHEQIHVRQKHSVDMLLAEVAVILQWFNPFAWFYRSAIEHNLEFLTDAEMLRRGTDPQTYQLNLVRVSVPDMPQGLTSNYNQNFLKTRITMMQAKHSSARVGWKYITLIALLVLSVFQLNAVYGTGTATQPAETIPKSAIPAQAEPTATETITASATTSNEPTQLTDDSNGSQLSLAPLSATDRNRSWTATVEGNEVCFRLMSRNKKDNHSWNWSHDACFPKSSLGTLPTGTMGTFAATREAGTMTFKGIFDGNDGVGTFEFTPDPTFQSALRQESITGIDNEEWIHLFLGDFTLDYLRQLRDKGYKPEGADVVKLMIFDIDAPRLNSLLNDVRTAGLDQPSLEKVIELTIHGVNGDYIRELGTLGFTNLSLQDIVQAKIHGVSSTFVQEMARAGFTNLSLQEVSQMAIHGVSVEHVAALKQAGYANLSAQDVIQTKIHGIDPDFIAAMNRLGFASSDVHELTQLSIHGVSADYVEMLQQAGYQNLHASDVTQARIHGVDRELIAAIQDYGFPTDDLRAVQQWAIHGVSRSDIEALGKAGYTDLSMQDHIQARIHGVTGAYAQSIKDTGLRNVTFQKLQQARIHGVTGNFIKRNLKEGKDIDYYLQLKIHGMGE